MTNPIAFAAACLASAAAAAAATFAFSRGKSSEKTPNPRQRGLRPLDDLAQTFGAPGTQTESILAALVAILAKYLEADLVAFLLPDAEGKELVVQPGAYGIEEKEGMFYRIPIENGEHSSARVFKSGQPFLTGDAQNDPDVISRYAKLWDIRSLMVLPLRCGEKTIGVMRVGSFRKDYFSQKHVDWGLLIAGEAAAVVEAAVITRHLSETAEQLKKSNRIKDEFISTVSHEFKTPLTTILGFLMLMLDGEAGDLSEQQKKFVKMSINAAKRLEMLVADILDLSKLEAGAKMSRRSFDLAKALRASAESQFLEAEKREVELLCEIEESLPGVSGDPRWISLAVDNLLSNAIKFTPPRGQVKIRAQRQGQEIVICISDTGVGIPPEEKERVFEKFYRSQASADLGVPGTGLGLAIVREIVAKHGGRLWLESEPQKGSRFYFSLPLPVPGQESPVGEASLHFGGPLGVED